MPVVKNKLTDPSGAPVVRALVHVSLVGSFTLDGTTEVLNSWEGHTDGNGTWSVTLAASSTYDGTTYYAVQEPSGTLTFVVPNGAGPYNLHDILVSPSPPVGPVYYTQAQVDAKLSQLVPITALRTWYTTLANRDYGPADILVIGDSITEGQGATVKNRRWIERLQSSLRLRYPTAGVAGGEGYVAANQSQTSFAPGWTYGGNVGGDGTFGWGHRTLIARSPNGFASRTVSGTSVKIAYTKQSALGSFAVFLDGSGGPAITVDTASGASGTAHDGGIATVSLGTRGSHTVKIAWASGGDCYINGLYVFDQDESVGVRVTDSGQYGSKTDQWVVSGNANQYVISDDVAVLQPALCIIELGANDYIQSVDPAATQANCTTLINQVQAACTVTPSFILLAAYQVAGSYAYQWSQYVAAMNAVAAGRTDTLFIDLSLRMLGPPPGLLALYAGDNVHPSDKGHSYIADVVTSFLHAR